LQSASGAIIAGELARQRDQRRQDLGEVASQDVVGVDTPPELPVWNGDDVVEYHDDRFDPIVCEICTRQGPYHSVLLCENCDAGAHFYCVGLPRLPPVDEDWYCTRCLTYEDIYGRMP
jgi:hypothetical protein